MNSFKNPFYLSSLNGRNGFAINGTTESMMESGFSVSRAGDINGDGIADLIIGAPGARLKMGASYVVFGSQSPFSANTSLSDLNGNNGFAIYGRTSLDSLGVSVNGAGDINGDSIADLIVSGAQTGAGYVIFGSRSPFPGNISLSDINGKNGFTISGLGNNYWSKPPVSGAGDINADGIADMIIGDSDAGASYTIFGSKYPFPANINVSELNGKNGFTIYGITSFDSLGYSVSGAGDINADGIADIVIGAFTAGSNVGASYVVFGSQSPFPTSINVYSLNGKNGFAINGIASLDALGSSVSGAGDINGDGIADLIIGAPGASLKAGASYVIFGSQSTFPASINVSDLNGKNGFAINGITNPDALGSSVSGAGDINGDGIADFIIGAPGAGSNVGASYVVFGSQSFLPASINVSDLNGRNGFAIYGAKAYENSGYSVSGAGDINDDGIADLIIGAPEAGSGTSYVVFGMKSTTASLQISGSSYSDSLIYEDKETFLMDTDLTLKLESEI
ncbi:FG-GAP repeat protein [Candidatus Jidaibacter acanthamoebae]|nr:FG-GAP repeat protein [Candidatus Jidaibacter acanthamoeba]